MNTIEEALQGANDIIAEDLSDDADIRKALRELVSRRGSLVCKAAEDAEADGVYKLYYDFPRASAGCWTIRFWPSTGEKRRAF